MQKLLLRRPLGPALFLIFLALLGARPGRAQSVLAQWPLTASYTATVATGISAPPATPTLSGLVVTTSGPAVGYSALGQATAPNADGTGWTNTILSTRYQEFPLTIAPGYTGRVDSIQFSTAINNTTSGRLAVAYSTDNFATATFIVGSSSGSTITGVAVNNVTQVTGSNSTYSRITAALNGSAGLTLPAAGRVAFRLYYSVGSTSARPAELKDLSIRGQVATVGAVTSTTAQVSFNTPTQGTSSYTITTSPAGGTATQTTAPTSGNGYTAVYTISGLTPGTAYTATVSGSTVYAATTVATTITSPSFTTASGSCPSVSSVAVGSVTQTGASVSFTPGNGNTSFVVTYTPAGGSTTTVSPAPNSSPVALSGLAGGTTYSVTVQSVCASGAGAAQSTTFTTLTCADPTGLAVSGVTSSGANVSFVPGTDNSSYAVSYYPTGSPGLAQTVSPAPTASPVLLTGLLPATPYTVTLQSTCSNGAVGNVLTRTFTTRLASSPVLQQWPLTANANDDPAARAAGVTASTGTLSNLVLSDGSSSDGESAGPLPAYSALGQGIAPTAGGTGWNGTVSLTRYAEYTVTAAAGGSVRVDSLIFSAGGYGSTMNVSVAYSTNGFATAGTFILGTQATPVALNKVSSSGYSVLRLPLTGPAGVTLAAGNTVSFRLYYALGTSSARHALTKNLYVTGVATAACPAATGVSIGNVSAVGAQLNFTPGGGNTSYTVTLTPQGGSPTTVTPAPTASPVTFTGLDASTTYTVTLQTNCGGTPGYVQTLGFTTPAASSAALQQWPLTANNTDNATVRSYAVTASVPSFSGLVASTNTTASSPPIPAYSAMYGQAFAPAGNGGGWSSSLSSTVYQEFALTAASGDNLRVDSLTFSTAFYNTANGRLAVAYSLDGFSTSTFVVGTLASPASVVNYNAANSFTTYRLALGGLTRASGQTLSVRLYYAAGTSSSGRYALLRNVYFSGEGFVNNLPNLTIGDTRNVTSGTIYGNVTVLPGGTGTLTGPLTAQGATMVQPGGVLNTNCQPVTGAGTFTLSAGAELRICDAAGITATGASGAIQVSGPRTYSPDAIYTYTGTTTGSSNPGTGDGLPAAVRTLNVSLAAATDTLQLGGNLTVASSLNLTQGILKTYAPGGSPSYVVTMNSGSTTLSETSSSFVLGQVRSATLFFGSDGSNSTFGGIGVRLVAHAATNLPGNTYVLRSTGQPAYGQGTSRSIRRQYRLVPTIDADLNVDATFTFNPSAAELNGIPAANLQLFSRPIAGGSWRPEPATIGATTATTTGLTHLSDWTLGNAANPLPVQLMRFEATRQGSGALLTWTTAQEKNNQGFEVQASADGYEFRSLRFVAGAGTSTSPRSYQYLDANAQPGLRYYRLRQVDLDGTATYSATRTVLLEGSAGIALQVAPNPFSGDALALFTQATTATKATLHLTDALGRVVRQQQLAIPAGSAQLSVTDLAGLPAGLYVAELVLDGRLQRVKLVRE